ncbi:MAG TPA: hypothetical protein VHY91_19995 [Pirellulales bacterium]|jgi:hypothetical protein|nr:hypothetical protein [Pirellulales bacterium]
MKSFCTLVVLGLLASSASAADIPQSALASIGLPGFVKMSQADAMTVRGKYYTIGVYGSSVANGPHGGSSTNGFYITGGGNGGHSSATGTSFSFSFSGGGSVSSSGVPTIVSGFGSIAGGGASASIH